MVQYVLIVAMYVLQLYETFALVLINMDRFLEVVLNITYSFYVTRRRINYVVIYLWTATAATSAAILAAYGFEKPNESADSVRQIFSTKVGAIADILYILSTIVIFAVIFYHFVATRSSPQPPPSKNLRRQSVRRNRFKDIFCVLRRSRFRFTVMLVWLYTLFALVPDLVQMMGCSMVVQLVFTITTELSYLADVVVFVAMDCRVSRLLLRRKGHARTSLRMSVVKRRKLGVLSCHAVEIKSRP